VSTRERLTAFLLRRPVRLAGGVLAFIALLLLFLLSYRGWQERTAALERENLQLQLQQLARGLAAEAAQLAETARDIAQTEASAQLVEDVAAAPGSKLESAELPDRSLDGFFVVNAAQVVRYSAGTVHERFSEGTPDVAVKKFLDSVVAARWVGGAAPSGHAAVGFAGDDLVAVHPILSHAASAAPLGWVVAVRSLSPAVLQRLQASVSGSLSGHALRQDEVAALSHVPRRISAELRASASGPSAGVTVTTGVSGAQSGAALLRDEFGRSGWIFQLQRKSPMLGAGGSGEAHRSLGVTVALDGLLALLVITVGAVAVFVLQRYFRHQRSVDARYKAIIDQTNDGIVIVDSTSHQVQYCNPAFLARLGYSNAEAEALTLPDIFADGNASTESVLARLRKADSKLALNMQQRCKSGVLIDIEVRCNALDVDGRDVLAYVTHDVSVRRKAEQQLIENQLRLDRMAHHDQLTGLPNRHYLASFLPEAIAEAKAASTMLGVVFLDLDRFKHINDTRGHETGDKLLQEVAARLRACVRDTDVVIRMGGDEFVVVFRNVKSYDEVTQGAGRIIDTLNRPIIVDEHPLQTTGSVGVSLFPRDGADMGELLKHSDTAMYQAKDRGRNNVQVFSHIMNRKLKHRVAMEASLREALRLKQFDVHYQPFVNLATRKIVGLEALMRWCHPVHGMIPADQFIPVAEETGLIVPMGNFVLHRTLQTMSAWRKAGVALVPVSLNIAPAQLQRGEFQSTISTLLKTHGLRPELLQLEMTERALFDSTQAKAGESRQDTMARLRDLGIKIAIDDFGTGYSSLSYLKNWRVDALKIDRSFVRDLVTDSSDLAIVSAIIAIARHMHIQVIAEGIEGYQQAEILRKLGCTIGQGFLFARPMPADQCMAMLGESAGTPDEEEDMLAVFASGRA
jgi:diguanylate cyclase (GGDEF)-like protein/PAS domain S-box-containing protein